MEYIDNKNKGFSMFGKFAILITAMLWILEASTLGPALTVIGAAFPGSTEVQLQYVMMAPYLTMLFASPFAGRLALRFDKKYIMLIGLIIYGIGGVIPVFMSTIPQVMVCRLICGIGAGIVVPMTPAIIADRSVSGERMKLMGYAVTLANVGNIAVGVIVGFVMMISWKAPFLVFSIAFIIAIIVLLGVPKCPPIEKIVEKEADENSQPVKMQKVLFFYPLALAFVYCNNSHSPINMAFLIIEDKICSPALIGIVIATLGVGAMLASLLFVPLLRAFKSYYITMSIGVFGIGYLLLSFSNTLAPLIIANVIAGMAMGFMVPYLNNMIALRSRNQQEKDKAMGLSGAGLPIGGFLAVPFGAFIKSLNPGQFTDVRWLFLVIGIMMLIVAVITVFTRDKKWAEQMAKGQ